jgi:hypothetical protein
MERASNHRKLGKAWSNSEFAENVACAYTAYVRHGTLLPDWAKRWSDEHERKDALRKQAEKNKKQEEIDAKLRQYNQLKKELGIK